MGEIDVDVAYGYSGLSLCTFPDDTIAYICGCGIVFYNTVTGARQFLWSPRRRPVVSLTVNHKRTLFAFADKGRDPSVWIYSYPNKAHVYSWSGGTRLEYADLAFSRDSQLFATLGTLPDFELQIRQLPIPDANLGASSPRIVGNLPPVQDPTLICESSTGTTHARFVSFNPMSPLDICTSGSGHVTFWKIDKQMSKLSLSSIEGKVSNHNVRLHSHSWTPSHEVLVGTTEGEIYMFDTATGYGDPLPEQVGTDWVSNIIVTRKHILASSNDGKDAVLKFYNLQSKHLERVIPLNTSYVSQLKLTPFWNALYVGCGDGVIFKIGLPGYENINISEEDFLKMETEITQVVDFHGGTPTGCCAVPGHKAIATIGSDCTLRLWDYHANALLAKENIGEAPLCLTAGIAQSIHLLAVGHGSGTVRLIDVDDIHKPMIIFKEKLAASAVVDVKWNSAGTLLAVLLENNRLYFVETVGDREVFGYVHALPREEEEQKVDEKDKGKLAAVEHTSNTGGGGGGNKKEPQATLSLQQQQLMSATKFLASLGSPKATSIVWIPDTANVLVAVSNGDVWQFSAPVEPSEADDLLCERSTLCEAVWKLDYAAAAMVYLKKYDSSHHLFTLNEDKHTKFYVLDLAEKRLPDNKDDAVAVTKSKASWADFTKTGTSISISPDGLNLLCTAADGKAVVRDIRAFLQEEPPKNPSSNARSIQRHSPFSKGVLAGCWSLDSRYIVTVGADGFIYVCGLKAPRRDVPPVRSDAAAMHEEPEDEDTFLVKRQKVIENFEYQANTDYRNKVCQRVDQLRVRLAELKRINETAAEMEKLEPEEFMVESEKRELWAEGDRLVAEVKEEMRWKNIARDYLADKIKKECYDVMEKKVLVVTALQTDHEVADYNVRFKDPDESRLLRKVKFLRKIEMEEQRRTGNKGLMFEVESVDDEGEEQGTVQPDDTAAAAIAAATSAEKAGSAPGSSASGNPAASIDSVPQSPTTRTANEEEEEVVKEVQPSDIELANESTKHILYSPYHEYTRIRQITQMFLLNGEINFMKHMFNKEHDALLVRKKSEMLRINEKNVRVKEILQLLEVQENIFHPTLSASEIPEKILEVNESEITVERWLSPDEQEKLEVQQAEAERRRREQEDDVIERALKIMMDGKLERDDTVVVKINKPEFAETKHPDEWSDEEVRAYRDYENKVKKKQEEDEKKQKQLEAELKNIKKENNEIASSFDSGLLDVLNKKLRTDQAIYECDLRIIKLAQAVFQQEEMEVKEQKLGAVLEEIKLKTTKTTQHVLDFKRDLDNKNERYQAYVAEEKNADKKFRQDFSEAEEYLEILVKLLKKRPKQKAKNKIQDQHDKEREEAQRNIDPFALADLPQKGVGGTDGISYNVSDLRLDKPDGLSDTVWKDFLDYRQYRFDMEKNMKENAADLAEAQKYYQKIKGDNEELHTKMELNLRKLSEFQEQIIRDSYNLDILHTFKQGQIEVEQAAVVTDYADAILIHKNKIQDLNKDIRASGAEKVQILRDIKDFKKGIRAVEWEIEMLDYTAGTLEIQYRHLHTLRVTKAMQEFIKGGGEGHNESERAKLQKKILHVKNSYTQKVEEKKKGIHRIKQLIKEKANENTVLEDQVSDANVVVKERDDIVALQSTGLDQARAHKMMKGLRVTRKLEDVAKAQQQELTELKKEIDKLRERTFPSFAVVSKRVVGNPDEKALE